MKSPLVLVWEKVPADEREPIEALWRRYAGILCDPSKEDWARDCLLVWLAGNTLVARETLAGLQKENDT